MAPVPDYADHRNRMLQRLEPGEAVLTFGSPHAIRNSDAEYRYRQHSDVLWLSGWEDPHCAVFLTPGDEPFVLFVQKKDPKREVWTGIRPGPEGAREQFDADLAYEWNELEAELGRLFQGIHTLHYQFAQSAEHDAVVASAIAKARRAGRYNGLDHPEVFISPEKVLHELRLQKQEDELAVMREAARITVEAHEAAMKAARPGVKEYEVEAVLLEHFRRSGSTGAGYTPIVAGGAGACILHYVTNREALQDGDLLLIDAGAEYQYYTADITRTFPVNGTFTGPQRDVYHWVLKAQEAAIDACRTGSTFKDVHDVATRILTEGMVELGLLEGDVQELIEEEEHKAYYMHGTSHWLGLDVHDVGVYGRRGESRPLEPGFVMTVEPGLYIPPDDEDAPEHLRGIGIRIEDDVLVTEGDPDVLTGALPKDIDEIEALCQ